MSTKPYLPIIAFCEEWLEKHGDNAVGAGWPRGDAETRYRVMLDLILPSPSPVTLLDFGCGASHLYEYILKHRPGRITYSGLDLSPKFLELSRRKYPSVPYYSVDVLDPAARELPVFDYAVLNGIFHYRGGLSREAMFDYLCTLLRRVAGMVRVGLAFNVMSTQVDWERDELFHVPVDKVLSFLSREVSRHVVLRHDYGLYEYTAYVYLQPTAPDQAGAKRWVGGKASP